MHRHRRQRHVYTLLLASCALAALASPATPAEKTRAQIQTEINTNFADNTSGQITPAKLRSVNTDINDSMLNLNDAGTAAFKNTGTSGNNVPLLDGANTWSGNQTVNARLNAAQDFALSGDITPAALSGNTNDYAPTGITTASTLRLSASGVYNLTGVASGFDGKILIIHNIGANGIVLKNEDSNSAAGNRFSINSDYTIQPDTSATVRYDATSLRWRIISPALGGGTGTVTSVTCGTGLSGGTITVSGTCAFDTITGGTVLANTTGGLAAPTANTPSAIIDTIGSTRGSVLYRGASGWAVLTPGTSGEVLTTNGAGADPTWTATIGTGTVTQVDSGTGLTGGPITTTGTLALANIADDRVMANISGGAAAPVANTMSDVLDATLSSTQGEVLYRGASGWAALGVGTSGQFLKTQGAGANPVWDSPVAAAGGSDTQVQYSNSGVLAGSTGLTWVSPALTVGAAGSTTGQVKLTGSTSGTITVQGQAAAGTYNFNLPTGAGTSGQALLSAGGGASPMTFGTLGVPAGGTGVTSMTSHGVLVGAGTSSVASLSAASSGTLLGGVTGADPAFSATPTLGVAGATKGTLGFAGDTSGTVTVQPASAAGTWALTLPTSAGSSGQLLQTDGAGVTSWVNGATVGGSNTQVQFNNSGALGGSANLTWASPALTVGTAGSATGQLKLTGSTSGTITVAGQAAAGTYNFNLPTGAGSSGQPLLSGGGGAGAMTFGTLGVGAGGTGLTSYTTGDVVYASGASTLAGLNGVATGNALISGGVATAPSWGKIGLTTHVSGTLPVANGGTGATARYWSHVTKGGSGQTCPNNTKALLTFGTAVANAQSTWNTGTSVYTATVAGLYQITVQYTATAVGSATGLFLELRVNGSGTATYTGPQMNMASTNFQDFGQSVTWNLQMAASDTFEVWVYAPANTCTIAGGANYTFLQARRVSD